MSTPIAPLADRVVAVREEAKTQTESGILLPENVREKPIIFEVRAIGPDVKTVKIGDKIVHNDDYSMTELKFDGVDYLIVKEENILAKIN